jgi:hypothetical protein
LFVALYTDSEHNGIAIAEVSESATDKTAVEVFIIWYGMLAITLLKTR